MLFLMKLIPITKNPNKSIAIDQDLIKMTIKANSAKDTLNLREAKFKISLVK